MVKGEEHLENNKFEGDLMTEETQIKQAPVIQKATNPCLECGHVRVEFWLIQGLGFSSQRDW